MTSRHPTPATKAVVLGHARCGSGGCYYLLRAAGRDIVHEPFHPSKWEGPWHAKPYDILAETDRLLAEHDGYKHLWDHVPLQVNLALCDHLVTAEVPVVHLRRADRAAQALSQLLAHATGHWGVECPGERESYREQVGGLRIDLDELRARIENIETGEAAYLERLRPGRLLEVVHEELYTVDVDLRRATATRVLAHVGLSVEGADLSSLEPSLKQTTGTLCATIANIEEIQRAFGLRLC